MLSTLFGCKSNKNHLALEKSPYLQQHKHNPVWWHAWNEEAFKLAKKENKPIFLSIGYSTCHWCHVMERECFENQEVADVLNKNFISIKVDREELPDVDKIYMNAVQAMGLRGGWPLSAFLTPELLPFFGGTYFPKDKFISLLNQITNQWNTKNEDVKKQAESLTMFLKKRQLQNLGEAKDVDKSIVEFIFESALKSYEPIFGGFSKAPKFPGTMMLRTLIQIAPYLDKNSQIQNSEIINNTLMSMFRGGLYDHIGGGFTRYSTDDKWLVPHFEKMLYDNASMSLTYFDAFVLTKDEVYKNVALDTLKYIERDMYDQNSGGFYSAEDADSEGHEGLFYIWDKSELDNILGESSKIFSEYFDITSAGNFEGKNIPNMIISKKEQYAFTPKIQSIKDKLFRHREKRIHPLKDKKSIAAWNGLMLSSFTKAYKVTNNNKYLEVAKKNAQFILDKLIKDNKLHRRFIDDELKGNGVLDDYAYIIQAFIDLFTASQDINYLNHAIELQKSQDTLFWSSYYKGYFYAQDNKFLITKNIEFTDNARPNSNAMSMLNLSRLYSITYDETYMDRYKLMYSSRSKMINEHPLAYSQALQSVIWNLFEAKTIVLAGEETDATYIEMKNYLNTNFKLPFSFVDSKHQSLESAKGKEMIDKKTTAYICQGKICLKPVTDINEFKKMAETL